MLTTCFRNFLGMILLSMVMAVPTFTKVSSPFTKEQVFIENLNNPEIDIEDIEMAEQVPNLNTQEERIPQQLLHIYAEVLNSIGKDIRKQSSLNLWNDSIYSALYADDLLVIAAPIFSQFSRDYTYTSDNQNDVNYLSSLMDYYLITGIIEPVAKRLKETIPADYLSEMADIEATIEQIRRDIAFGIGELDVHPNDFEREEELVAARNFINRAIIDSKQKVLLVPVIFE